MKLISYSSLKSEKGIMYSAEHLRRLERDGSFPIRIPGHRRYWVESEIDDWIQTRAGSRKKIRHDPSEDEIMLADARIAESLDGLARALRARKALRPFSMSDAHPFFEQMIDEIPYGAKGPSGGDVVVQDLLTWTLQ